MVDPQQNPQAPVASAEVWPPSPSATQDPAVDAILVSVAELLVTPTGEHAARYLALHDALRAELDADPIPGTGTLSGESHQPPAAGLLAIPIPGAGRRPGPRSGRSE